MTQAKDRLREAAGPKVLASSRMRLALRGEHEVVVPLAAERLTQYATLRWDRGERRGLAEVLTGLAILAVLAGLAETGVILAEAVGGLRPSTGARARVPERIRLDRSLEAARSALQAARYEAASERGRSLPLTQAGEVALAIDVTPADFATTPWYAASEGRR